MLEVEQLEALDGMSVLCVEQDIMDMCGYISIDMQISPCIYGERYSRMKHSLNKCHVNCVLWIVVQTRQRVGSSILLSWVQFLAPLLSICVSSQHSGSLFHKRGGHKTYQAYCNVLKIKKQNKTKHLVQFITRIELRPKIKISFTSLISCVSLGWPLHLSQPQFLHLPSGDHFCSLILRH